MNGKNKIGLSLTAAVAIACLGLTTQANADLINGEIAFSSDTEMFLNGPIATATAVANWGKVTVDGVVGDFASTITDGDTVLMAATPWSFTSPANGLWSVGGFTFDLASVAISFQSASAIVIDGSGSAYGNGFDVTPGVITLTFNQSGKTVNFSATSAVPDAGTTLMLLGMGMLGLGSIRRKLA